ncbi:hypothetical protein [Flavobacterium sp. FlaQc-47]|uniref:hypothetical protein n=1 Tax=Flavobacterium sp. FlaQc-47 TaxID=3374180 RepID=UPI003756BBBA
MKFNYTALVLAFLIGVLIFISPPFVMSLDISAFIRIPMLCMITLFFLLHVVKKKKFVYFYLPFISFFVIEVFYWKMTGNSLEGASYFLTYVILIISVLLSIHRIKNCKILIVNFYFWLILITSVLCIISFLAFNLNLLPYSYRPIGGDEGYKYFYFPILGYINAKNFDSTVIGRACGYLFEPSYMGWFLTANFFLISKFLKNKKKIFFVQLIVFMGALSTMSTMMWLVFFIVFGIATLYLILRWAGMQEKMICMILFVIFFLGFMLIPKDKIIESLGPSSSDDREERVGVSFLLIASASPLDLLLGRSPGYLEKKFDKGESNQIIKLLVENGIISTVLVLIFVIYFTYKSKWFMIANLLFLNSVVILFTPLFMFNILICKWLNEIEEGSNEVSMK